jgi:hypothetical protein
MSEQPTAPPATGAEPAQPGPLSRLVERFEGRAEPVIEHAEAALAGASDDVKTELTGHASALYDFTGDFLDAIGIIDPADEASFKTAAAAFQALVPKAVAVAGKVSSLLSAALKPA